ncbi:competence type IV pilus minor pilin ComGF [Bacillus sp. FJAT-27245]|uniref:competence type IV pilus minor pilin ComGF n=1 Tax=Bacillus sp. FJAT-27245 TaxID=1684144 RepID=UPI0006A7A7F3|nr:competence type IV pilus minor pilin ComGF [Bacillus sp. FJAT-27245]
MNIQPMETEQFADLLNEKGFSLAEMLIALGAFCIIAYLLVPSVFVIASNQKHAGNRLQEMEWDVFLNQAKKEMRMCSSAEVVAGRLVMINGKDTIIYEKYGNLVRRRVNSTGHEVLLQNIASVTFSRNGQTIIILLKDVNGKEYKGSIHSFVKWGAT